MVTKTLLYIIDETLSSKDENDFVDLTSRILDINAIPNQKVVNNYRGMVFQQPVNITPDTQTKYFLLVQREIQENDVKEFDKEPFIEHEDYMLTADNKEVIKIKKVTSNIYDLENLMFDDIIDCIANTGFKQSLLIY